MVPSPRAPVGPAGPQASRRSPRRAPQERASPLLQASQVRPDLQRGPEVWGAAPLARGPSQHHPPAQEAASLASPYPRLGLAGPSKPKSSQEHI